MSVTLLANIASYSVLSKNSLSITINYKVLLIGKAAWNVGPDALWRNSESLKTSNHPPWEDNLGFDPPEKTERALSSTLKDKISLTS